MQTLSDKEPLNKKPSHELDLGAASICLPYPGLVYTIPSSIKPTLRAVFSVHLKGSFSQKDKDSFIAWTRSLPENASIVLEELYSNGSGCLLFLTSPWAVWSKLARMDGYCLQSEDTGSNTLGIYS
ncbi:hypothetical protein BJX99DRAFT_217843 [Aspergillus californicus]